ncbi:MAG: Molybdopterin biosynthesis protein MoeA [Myxococcaceae bacterium]|nr:Molybdopterin biosynthesis protein MoeA [Myxococcaceae bacterium]
MRSVEDASAEILAAFEPIGEERVALLDGLGRFLSRDVRAQSDLPAFDNSAMDGYALRRAELATASAAAPVVLPVLGESRAGGPPPEPLARGSAMRIFTGAMVPAEADAVVLQEDAVRVGDHVTLREPARAGENIRRRGSDLRHGELALALGSRLGAGSIGLLASQDVGSVTVYRRPRVAILATGDELREIGEPARPGSIVNSNAYALAAQVLEAGAEPWVLPPSKDLLAEAQRAIRAGLAADVLVIVGGVSVGDYDVVRDALVASGVALDFWKIRMKPGKPVAFARYGRIPVLGLPGNPVSAWVTFELFVRPGLRKMLGDPAPERARLTVSLAAALTRNPGRTEFARAKLVHGPAGWVAELAKKQGSGSLPALADVHALVIIPAECEHLAAGAKVEALLLTQA